MPILSNSKDLSDTILRSYPLKTKLVIKKPGTKVSRTYKVPITKRIIAIILVMKTTLTVRNIRIGLENIIAKPIAQNTTRTYRGSTGRVIEGKMVVTKTKEKIYKIKSKIQFFIRFYLA